MHRLIYFGSFGKDLLKNCIECLFLIIQVELMLRIAFDESLAQRDLVEEQVLVIDFQLLRFLILMTVHI
ncbi:hypothetical protein D3C86_2076460 [compost metagenome]